MCQGNVQSLDQLDGLDQALLRPASAAEIAHARALCTEYGVTLMLDGAAGPFQANRRACLRVDPQSLTAWSRVAGSRPTWRAQPGVRLEELARAGLTQFQDAPSNSTLAQWVAERRTWASGCLAQSGLLRARVLLADGTQETLGAFGEQDQQPLRTAALQTLIPALFQLMSGPDGVACRAQSIWPGQYRLDALAPRPPATVNLAHLLLGHGATLAWIESLEFRVSDTLPPCVPPPPGPATAAAARLDTRIKALFDPQAIFPAYP